MSVDAVLDRAGNFRDTTELQTIHRLDFDPRRDISTEEREKIIKAFGIEDDATNMNRALHYLNYFTLFGEEPPMSDESKRTIESIAKIDVGRFTPLSISSNNKDPLTFLYSSLFFKTFYPQNFSINETQLERATDLVKTDETANVMKAYAYLTMLAPDKKDIEFEEKLWRSVKKNTDQVLRDDVKIMNLASLRLIYGDRIKEFVVDIDWEKEIDNLHNEFSSETSIFYFLHLAHALTILSAEKAEIVDGGIKLTMPTQGPVVSASPALPEVERFNS
jgi:hypothetical protein